MPTATSGWPLPRALAAVHCPPAAAAAAAAASSPGLPPLTTESHSALLATAGRRPPPQSPDDGCPPPLRSPPPSGHGRRHRRLSAAPAAPGCSSPLALRRRRRCRYHCLPATPAAVWPRTAPPPARRCFAHRCLRPSASSRAHRRLIAAVCRRRAFLMLLSSRGPFVSAPAAVPPPVAQAGACYPLLPWRAAPRCGRRRLSGPG